MGKPNGGKAFQDHGGYHMGMTMRQWYAGKALMGYLANTDEPVEAHFTAQECFKYADAMIAFEANEKS